MKLGYWISGLLALALAWLAWQTIDLAIENDGLKQVAAGHSRSVQTLLRFAQVATRCDISATDLVDTLGGTKHQLSSDPKLTEIAVLAFKARFSEDALREVEIVDVGKVALCQPR